MNKYYLFQARSVQSLKGASLVIVIVCILSILTKDLLAQDSQRGRLSDGRAFRTDQQGNQLVDYIAELEVNVEALERQVKGLEDENRNKQNIIARLQRGEKAEGELVERELKSGQNQSDNNSQNNRKVSNNCSAQVAQCNERIEDLKVDYQLTLSEQNKELLKLREQVFGYKDQLIKLQEQYESSKAELIKVKASATDSRAVTRGESPLDASTSTSFVSRNVGETRIQAVDMLRGKMLTDLNSLQGLIAHRDTLAKDIRGRGLPVALNSRDSSEIRERVVGFRAQINSATKVHELSSLRGVINELRGSIQSEIASLKRLARAK